jgi:transporter family protein
MQSLTWLPATLLSGFFAALVAIFGKLGISNVDSTLATTVRAGCMFVLLLGVAAFSGKLGDIGTIDRRAWLYIVLAGIAGALSWICYFWALKHGDASRVAPIEKVGLAFVIIMSALVLGETLTWKTILGSVLVIAGAALVAL